MKKTFKQRDDDIKRYKVCADHLEYLEEQEIEAHSEEEAKEIYYDLWERGELSGGGSQLTAFEVEEIKE